MTHEKPLAPSPFDDPEVEKVLRLRAKAALRKRMRGLRSSVPAEGRAERSARIVERVAALPAFAAAHTIGLFAPITSRAEVDVRPLDALARSLGKRVAYPQIDQSTGAMTLRIAGPEVLEEQGLGFAEPPADAPEPTIDAGLFIVAPALALDASGNRLGYGKGYYDRMLLEMAPPAIVVAVAFEFQLLAEVPTTEGDQPIPTVITDARLIETGAGS